MMHRSRSRSDRCVLERTANIRLERHHFQLKLAATWAAADVFRKLVRSGIGLSSDEPPCVLAVHGRSSLAAPSGAGVKP